MSFFLNTKKTDLGKKKVTNVDNYFRRVTICERDFPRFKTFKTKSRSCVEIFSAPLGGDAELRHRPAALHR